MQIIKNTNFKICPIGFLLMTDLKKQFFAVDVIDQQSVMFIHHSKFIAWGTHVKAANWCWQFQQCDGKRVVDKYLQDLRYKNNDQQSKIKTDNLRK